MPLATSGSRCLNPSRTHHTNNPHNTPDTSNHSCDHSRDGHVRALYDVPGLVLYDVPGLVYYGVPGLVLYNFPGLVLCPCLQPLR